MKKKDIFALIFAVVVFVITGAVVYRYVFPPQQNTGIKVEVPRPVVAEFDRDTIDNVLLKEDQVKDYTPNISPDANAKPKPVVQ